MGRKTKEHIFIDEIGEMRAYLAVARSCGNESGGSAPHGGPKDPCPATKDPTPAQAKGLIPAAKGAPPTIGLVPTMGALHDGHISLIRRSAGENDLTIVSIFVNPIQFDDVGDFAAYPKSLKRDTEEAYKAGANVVFAPGAAEMYPEGFSTYIDMTGITERLCGASRISHFRGVLTVVAKLFGICEPDRAYFGEKDAQQLSVIKKMAAELCIPVEVIGCPTIREEDGLAMSSRNSRLSKDERIAALCLYRALREAKALFDAGEQNPELLTGAMRTTIEEEPLARLDYAELVDRANFETPQTAREGDLLALAVYIGNVRLIDNMRL